MKRKRKEEETARKQGQKKKKGDEPKVESSEDEDDREAERRRAAANAGSGLTIEDFKRLKIPDSVMKDGMIFIWCEKEYIYQICLHLETQGFQYVENVCYVMIEKAMEKEVRNFNTIDATPAFTTEDFTYLKKSHKSLLMFRRVSKDDGKLELRHQRTGDVVFDWYDPMKPQ